MTRVGLPPLGQQPRSASRQTYATSRCVQIAKFVTRYTARVFAIRYRVFEDNAITVESGELTVRFAPAHQTKYLQVKQVLRLDYISCVLTVLSTVLVGRKLWHGWIVAGANSVIVCVIGLRTAQFGFVPANLFCIALYSYNLWNWRKR
jgi:hypothetical protein